MQGCKCQHEVGALVDVEGAPVGLHVLDLARQFRNLHLVFN